MEVSVVRIPRSKSRRRLKFRGDAQKQICRATERTYRRFSVVGEELMWVRPWQSPVCPFGGLMRRNSYTEETEVERIIAEGGEST